MNPIGFAMRHPITMAMIVVALFGCGGLAIFQMRIDVFPEFNNPQIYVIQNFNGMSPDQIEGLLVNQIETELQYVDGVKTVESKSIQQMALIKVSFYPGTDMSQAMAELVAEVNRAAAFMPKGVLPPQIMRMDPGSVPIGYLVLNSKTTSLGVLADLAEYDIRPLIQKRVPGTVGTSPFGANVRSIVVTVDPDRLRSYNLTPNDVAKALMEGNVVIPSGNLYLKDQMPLVPTNAMVDDISKIGDIPLRANHNVYVRNVATIADATDVNYGYAMVDGKRSVYVPIVKKNTASALTVVREIRDSMALFQSAVPEGVEVRYEFDQTPTVVDSIVSLAGEGAIGAVLTGLMVLLFLRDWRSVVVVVFNIPLALLGSLFGLWCTNNTINVMTLGGLALAIGMLVDEATVEVENVHAQMAHVKTIPRAVRLGNHITAVPRLLAMLCILSVFIPAFIMTEPMHSLFVPLSLAVGFSMITSYLLSSTLVPVLATWLLKGPKKPQDATDVPEHSSQGHGPRGEHAAGHDEWMQTGFFGNVQRIFVRVVGFTITWRWVVVPAYVATCLLILVVVGMQLGRELFPAASMGQFVLRFRMPPGTNFELTREAWIECLHTIEEEAGAGNVEISMGFAGQQAPNFALNNMILFMRGPDDGQMRVKLRDGSDVHVHDLEEKLRQALPRRLVPWLTGVLRSEGYSPEEAEARAGLMTFGFQPGDVVSEVMSFGSPTPIEVIASSTHLEDARAYQEKVMGILRANPYLRDVQFHQELEYPTVQVNINREKANLAGVTAESVGRDVLEATSSSRMLYRNYWIDKKTGRSYQVQVQTPVSRMTSTSQVGTLPVEQVSHGMNLMVRDVATIGKGSMPGEYDRTQMQRYVSITANVVGEDLGRAAAQVEDAIKDAGKPPRSVQVDQRGQVKPMNEMFESLAIGLGAAVFVILVMLTAYFQSPRLALTSIGAVPGVLSGVVLILWVTRTTLNIESFMGTIMSVGVSVSNSVMLITFTMMEWQKGASVQESAIRGAGERLRPILMTACAMTIGMVPMSLGLEAGSKMEAPLGIAVIGGLVVSTFCTLLILPSIYTIVMGESKYKQPSIDPDDPESEYFDGGEEALAEHAQDGREQVGGTQQSPEAGQGQDARRQDGGELQQEHPASRPDTAEKPPSSEGQHS